MECQTLSFSRIGSTNTYLKDHRLDLGPFAFVYALSQDEGRGRSGRKWDSPMGECLAASLLIQDSRYLSSVGALSCLSALAACNVLKGLGLSPMVKWPNDVYLNGKKAVGVLLEGSLPEYAVLGIGINVAQRGFPMGYRVPPTSLYLETKKELFVPDLAAFLREELLSFFQSERLDEEAIYKAFEPLDYLKGKTITGTYEGKPITGTALGVDSSFRLRLLTEEGEVALSSGEVSSLSLAGR